MSEIKVFTFDDAVAVIGGKPGNGGWYNGLCPAHPDSTPSLGIKKRDLSGTFAVKCQAGCDRKAVIAALEKKTGKRYGKKRQAPCADRAYTDLYARMKQINPLFLGLVYHVGQRNYNGIPAVTFDYFDEQGITGDQAAALREQP